VGLYSLIEPRQRSFGNVTPHRLPDNVADHFLQLPFGNFGSRTRRVFVVSSSDPHAHHAN
jgi:hypothetical protein